MKGDASRINHHGKARSLGLDAPWRTALRWIVRAFARGRDRRGDPGGAAAEDGDGDVVCDTPLSFDECISMNSCSNIALRLADFRNPNILVDSRVAAQARCVPQCNPLHMSDQSLLHS
jgi:hypothetical protein